MKTTLLAFLTILCLSCNSQQKAPEKPTEKEFVNWLGKYTTDEMAGFGLELEITQQTDGSLNFTYESLCKLGGYGFMSSSTGSAIFGEDPTKCTANDILDDASNAKVKIDFVKTEKGMDVTIHELETGDHAFCWENDKTYSLIYAE